MWALGSVQIPARSRANTKPMPRNDSALSHLRLPQYHGGECSPPYSFCLQPLRGMLLWFRKAAFLVAVSAHRTKLPFAQSLWDDSRWIVPRSPWMLLRSLFAGVGRTKMRGLSLVETGEMSTPAGLAGRCEPLAAGETIQWWPCRGLRRMHSVDGREGVFPLKPSGSEPPALAVTVRTHGVPRFAPVCGGLCGRVRAR